jgi:hypothetical protein
VSYLLQMKGLRLSVLEACKKRAKELLSGTCTLKRAEVAYACCLNFGGACSKRPVSVLMRCSLELVRLSVLRSLKRASWILEACGKCPESVEGLWLLELARLSVLRSLKRADFSS